MPQRPHPLTIVALSTVTLTALLLLGWWANSGLRRTPADLVTCTLPSPEPPATISALDNIPWSLAELDSTGITLPPKADADYKIAKLRALIAAMQNELGTPQATLLAFHKAIRAEKLDAARFILVANNVNARAFINDYTLLLVTWHRYERIMKSKFPNNRDVLVWEMFSDRDIQFNLDAIANATFKIENNRATITSKTSPGLAKGDLVLEGNIWRLHLPDAPEFKNYPAPDLENNNPNIMFVLARLTPALDAAIDAVEAGTLTKPAQVVEFVKKESESLLAKLPKEAKSQPASR